MTCPPIVAATSAKPARSVRFSSVPVAAVPMKKIRPSRTDFDQSPEIALSRNTSSAKGGAPRSRERAVEDSVSIVRLSRTVKP